MNPNVPSTFPKLNLQAWIKQNAKHLKPPVSNKQLFSESKEAIVFVSGGPNTRNDFHVNPTEELFYQLKGDIAVRVRPLDGSKPQDVVVKEGELFLLPRWVPHRPQRPAGTVGLIVEFPRPKVKGRAGKDGLQWYCPECDTLVYDVRWRLKRIDEDLAEIMDDFWEGPKKRRTCKACGCVISRAGTIEMKDGKVRAAGKKQSKSAVGKKAGKQKAGKAAGKSGKRAE